MIRNKPLLLVAYIALSFGLSSCAVEDARGGDAIHEVSAATLSAERLQLIESALQEEVDAGVRAGFVAMVTNRSGVVYEAAIGMSDRYNEIPMETNARFRIASMSKPIVTAAMMQLVDRGEVLLTDPVSLYIPAYADARVATSLDLDDNGAYETRPAARAVTIHDLLTHMAGIGYVFSGATDLDRAYLEANLLSAKGDLEARVNMIAALPLYEDPGTRFRYSYATDVAGRIIEVASGMTLEAYLKENLFEPLEMRDTEFFMDETDFDRLAIVNEFNEAGAMIRSGETPLGGGLNDQAFGVMSAGAGLISSGPDYARFMMMLLNEGSLDGVRVLSPATVRLMMSDNTPFDARPDDWRRQGISFGIGGAVIVEPGFTGNISAPGEWGWAGYWDTSFVVNPKDGIAVVLLAQTQPGPNMPPSRARNRVKAITYGALER